MTLSAAGIMFVTPDRKALFLKRGAGGDCPGMWALPGGRKEADETPEQTAIRETREEIGFVPRGSRALLTRSISNCGEGGATAPAMPPPATAEALPQGDVAGGSASDAIIVPAAIEQVDFSTFLQTVNSPFDPVLNEEHTGYAWASIDAPPEPLHPGVATAIARLDMNELDVARAMAEGRLTSPQRYHNVTLFAIRISGVGTSYRSGHDEFVWRDPSVYMNDEFVQRCNGLTVIFEHPENVTLDSNEFSERSIGSIFLPYLRHELNEVWGIAKIYDDAAIEIMTTKQMSTSPSVVLRPGENTKMKLDDGSTLLIEGEPALLDHIAVCAVGVWDKGGEPSGVRNDSVPATPPGETKVTEKTTEGEDKRADASGVTLEAILTAIQDVTGRVGSLTARMDAEDEKREAEKKADEDEDDKDKAAKKADEDEEEKMKKAKEAKGDSDAPDGETKMADADKDEAEDKKADSIVERIISRLTGAGGPLNETQRRIAQVERSMPKHLSDADYAAMSKTQARADVVFQAFGDAAPRPLQGEDNNAYRRRLATDLKTHAASEKLKTVDLMAIGDSVAFELLEDAIYNDAMAAAKNPVNLERGRLREIHSQDAMTGRRITTFHGEPSAWMSEFMQVPRVGYSDSMFAARKN